MESAKELLGNHRMHDLCVDIYNVEVVAPMCLG
jgi:hypothetical protein